MFLVTILKTHYATDVSNSVSYGHATKTIIFCLSSQKIVLSKVLATKHSFLLCLAPITFRTSQQQQPSDLSKWIHSNLKDTFPQCLNWFHQSVSDELLLLNECHGGEDLNEQLSRFIESILITIRNVN